MSRPARQPRLVAHLERRRQRQHNAVMSEENLPNVSHLDGHSLVPSGRPEWIQDAAALEEILAHLRATGVFAFDTEFISELSYWPRLCLIQVATPERIALIDPLGELDVTPFWELVADPGVLKLVHAGQQDLEPVMRLLGKRPARIFDTQIAAGLIGLPWPLALNKLVAEMLGADISKGPAFTDWSCRPLDEVQVFYAANDVRFLPAMHALMQAKLDALGRSTWLESECETLCREDLHRTSDDDITLKVRGAGNLKPSLYIAVKHLALLREDIAREANLPPRSVIRDETLLDLARRPVYTVAELQQSPVLPRSLARELGEQLVQALVAGRDDRTSRKPANNRLEEKARERQEVDNLLALAQCFCLGQQVSPALCYSRQDMLAYSRDLGSRKTGEDGADSSLLKGWRAEFIGHPLREFLAGRTRCEISWNKHGLVLAVRDSKAETH